MRNTLGPLSPFLELFDPLLEQLSQKCQTKYQKRKNIFQNPLDKEGKVLYNGGNEFQ